MTNSSTRKHPRFWIHAQHTIHDRDVEIEIGAEDGLTRRECAAQATALVSFVEPTNVTVSVQFLAIEGRLDTAIHTWPGNLHSRLVWRTGAPQLKQWRKLAGIPYLPERRDHWRAALDHLCHDLQHWHAKSRVGDHRDANPHRHHPPVPAEDTP